MGATLNIRKAILAVTLSVCLASLAGLNLLHAQGTTATILGTVTDTSGAAIAGAAVEVKNTGTGLSQNVTTDPQGRYRVPDLGVGDYEVKASQSGFSTVTHQGITLTVGAQSVVDVALPVGQQQQTVTVEGQASQVQTTDAAIGSLVTEQQMVELPLNGRNFEQLILLAPGVQEITAFTSSAQQGRAPEYSIGGSRPEGQMLLLDDEPLQNYWNKGMGSITGSSLGVEAIGEFQTLVNSYSAQFGGNGAVVNSVSKSGTNSFHGTLYDFLRNSVMDSRTFFTPTHSPLALKRNQFGGSGGGPIVKDKAFFFVNYEGVQQVLGETQVGTVPAGNPVITATNPATAAAIAQTLLLWPKPTTIIGNGIGTETEAANQVAHENYVLGRFDYTLSSADSLFVRYVSDKAGLTEPFGGVYSQGQLDNWPEQDSSHSQFTTLEWRRVVSPTLVNVARVSYSRPVTSSVSPPPADSSVLQFFPGSGREDGTVAVTGLSTLGGAATAFTFLQNRFTEADDVLWTKGAHSIRFGMAVSRLQNNTFYPVYFSAGYTFQSLALFLAGTAQRVLGVPDASTSYPNRDFREIDLTPYVQDDWKVTPKLTVNLGLRYEFVTNPVDTQNNLNSILNFATATGYTHVSHVFQTNPTYKNFDPRIGFAYDPFADHKTAIRGGFGIFHDLIPSSNYGGNFYAAPPSVDYTQLNPIYPTPFVGTVNPPTPSAGSGFNLFTNVTPYVMQYNLNIQHEVAKNTILSVGYVGSRGVHLLTQVEQNPPLPTIGPNGVYQFSSLVNGVITAHPRLNPLLGVFTDFQPITNSRYNSLQVAVNRRFTRSLQAQVAYTWSRCLDDGSFWGSFNNASAAYVENPFNQNPTDYGVCSYDVTQTFRLNGLWALPFHGNRFVEGWQLSGIFSANTGQPFELTDGFDDVGLNGGDTPRPNYVAGCDSYAGAHTVNEWYNPACYTVQAPGTLGNLGRDTGRGPNLFNTDIALLKDTKIREQLRLQFRAEIFNIFNNVNFALPNISLFTAGASGACTATGAGCGNPNPSAGRITSIVGTPRQIQLALKLIF
jgi:hypothetical protein